jgi:multiple sugar transport system permease protein
MGRRLQNLLSIKYVFLLPALIWTIAFVIYPLLNALSVSFFSYTLGRGRTAFVAFNNFVDVLTREDFWNSFRITVLFVACAVGAEMILGTFMAWLVSRDIKFQNTLRTIFTAPMFTTAVAIGYLGVTLLHQTGGPINFFLGSEIAWISQPTTAFIAIVVLDIWRWTPFVFIIMLAGFQSIPMDMYENAYLETNSEWRILAKVVLPYLVPTLAIAFLFRMVRAFKVFGLPLSLTGGGPGDATEVYTILTYRVALEGFDFGHGSAMAFLFLIFVMVIVFRLVGQVMKNWYQ